MQLSPASFLCWRTFDHCTRHNHAVPPNAIDRLTSTSSLYNQNRKWFFSISLPLAQGLPDFASQSYLSRTTERPQLPTPRFSHIQDLG